LANVV